MSQLNYIIKPRSS